MLHGRRSDVDASTPRCERSSFAARSERPRLHARPARGEPPLAVRAGPVQAPGSYYPLELALGSLSLSSHRDRRCPARCRRPRYHLDHARAPRRAQRVRRRPHRAAGRDPRPDRSRIARRRPPQRGRRLLRDRKSTRLNSSHVKISYAVFCLKKKKKKINDAINSNKNKKKEK